MRRIAPATLLALVICVAANAQTTTKQTKDGKVAQELKQLERDWSAAYLKHDTATIDHLLADEYVGTDGRGIITTKAQEIEEAKPPEPGHTPPFIVLDESVTDMNG